VEHFRQPKALRVITVSSIGFRGMAQVNLTKSDQIKPKLGLSEIRHGTEEICGTCLREKGERPVE
jgi:hypothetical protein